MTSDRHRSAEPLPRQEHEELTALLNLLADGGLDDAEQRRLREILDRGESARRVFREFAALHAGLHWDYPMLLASGLGSPPRGDEQGGDRWPPFRRVAAILVSAAAVAAASLAAWLVLLGSQSAWDFAGGRLPLATVTQTRFLLPALGDPPLMIGQRLDAGRISLAGGAVELSLRNGVVVVFEGPGEFDLNDELSATLHDGNVVVRMPDGMKGFVVRTPATDVLDLGTEFAVSIGAGNTTDVQVYDGAVIASPGGMQQAARLPKRLEAGEAARFLVGADAATVPMAFRPTRFVRRLPADVGIPLAATSAENDLRQYGPARQASITVHRAPAGMLIDGRLDDWADKPGFSGTLGGAAGCVERAEGRMMYDDTFLYIAAHVGDPLPLRSIIDPEIDGEWGWRGGGIQVRVSTDRQLGWPAVGNGPSYYGQRQMEPTAEQEALARNPRLAHLTMWFHAPSKTPCLTINHGMLFANAATNPPGFLGAFIPDADGQGYTMEYAIPWSLLGCDDDPPRRGDVLAAVWQVLWGDEAGRMRREQMVEIRNPDEPLRINVWERAATWGRAEYR
jgi:ferric-dicitrate binding protein FerR (iron transport regulator)